MCQRHGYRVAYLTSRSAVRSVVLDAPDVLVFDTDAFDAVAQLLRWVDTMTAETVVGAVGSVPESVSHLVDVAVDRPLVASAVDGLTDRLSRREQYARAMEPYYEAAENGAGGAELETLRSRADECAAALDAADQRSVLDAIGG